MDFLTFKDFISIPALIGFYYLGAVVMPMLMWIISLLLSKKLSVFSDLHHTGKDEIWNRLGARQKALFISLFTMAFLFMELFWRMFFEFLIAYMQIRDALLQ